MSEDQAKSGQQESGGSAGKKRAPLFRYGIYAIALGLAAYLLVTGFGSGATHRQWIGVKAPDFTVTTLEGKQLRLSDLQGKRVLLDLFATWCPPCRREIPHFIALAKETSPDDLAIVGISYEDPAKLKAFVASEGINYPVASSNALPDPYGKTMTIPTTFVIDRNGVIQDVATGYHDLSELKALATEMDYTGPIKSPPKKKPGT